MNDKTDIEAARDELYEIAKQHNHNFQHEAVQAASQRLDVLIVEGQSRRQQGAQEDEIRTIDTGTARDRSTKIGLQPSR